MSPQHSSDLPQTGFCRVHQILRVLPIARSTWWKGVKDKRFPQPVKPSPFGASVTVWRCEDIHELIATAGAPKIIAPDTQ